MPAAIAPAAAPAAVSQRPAAAAAAAGKSLFSLELPAASAADQTPAKADDPAPVKAAEPKPTETRPTEAKPTQPKGAAPGAAASAQSGKAADAAAPSAPPAANAWSWLMSLLTQATPAVATQSGPTDTAGETPAPHPAAAGKTATAPADGTGAEACAVNAVAALAAPAMPIAMAAADAKITDQKFTTAAASMPLPNQIPPDAGKPAAHAAADAAPTPSPSPAPPAAAPDSNAAVLVIAPTAFARTLAEAAAVMPAAARSTLPPNQAEWPEALHEQVRWQLDNKVQEARLQLHPAELGSVQVQLRLSDKGVDVQFAAAQPQAREALAAALPQLRAMLAEGGMLLTQAQVGGQPQAHQQPRQQRPRGGSAASEADSEPAAPAQRIVRVGLVDDFA